jgi:hypothetical protein
MNLEKKVWDRNKFFVIKVWDMWFGRALLLLIVHHLVKRFPLSILNPKVGD